MGCTAVGCGHARVRRELDTARNASRRLRADRAALPASRGVDTCRRTNRLACDLSRTLNLAPIHMYQPGLDLTGCWLPAAECDRRPSSRSGLSSCYPAKDGFDVGSPFGVVA
ncbi:protein of unknown function [Burkholderia multivorans]